MAAVFRLSWNAALSAVRQQHGRPAHRALPAFLRGEGGVQPPGGHPRGGEGQQRPFAGRYTHLVRSCLQDIRDEKGWTGLLVFTEVRSVLKFSGPGMVWRAPALSKYASRCSETHTWHHYLDICFGFFNLVTGPESTKPDWWLCLGERDRWIIFLS